MENENENEPNEPNNPPIAAVPMRLWAAVLAAQSALKPVTKDKTAKVRMSAGGEYTYKFASTEDMMAAARDALLANGVMAQRVQYHVANGPAGPEVRSSFRLVHPESGEHESFPPIAMPIAGKGAADKVLAGALTYAWSYWLRDVLAIPREDENEPDRRKSDDGSASYHRGPPSTPRETQRSVTVPEKPSRPPSKPKPPSSGDPRPEKGTPEGDARSVMVQAAKQLVAAASEIGVAIDVYAIAGKAALNGDRWNANEAHTAAQYKKAAAAFDAELVRLQTNGDAPHVDDVPTICAACGGRDGAHTDPTCPESDGAA